MQVKLVLNHMRIDFTNIISVLNLENLASNVNKIIEMLSNHLKKIPLKQKLHSCFINKDIWIY